MNLKEDNYVTMEALVRGAENRCAEFAEIISGVGYEIKGILFSEMLFFWLIVQTLRPSRILESGRARGQSTLILSRCFPDTPIISIECDRNSRDVAVAENRLKGQDNVTLLFGDATKMLPRMLMGGDVVMIDGPKGHRALRLALRLLSTGKPAAVFLHDAGNGSVENNYLQKNLIRALYSYVEEFSRVAHHLDEGCCGDLPDANKWIQGRPPLKGYGFGLACLLNEPGTRYHWLVAKAVLDGIKHRISK